MCNSNTRLPCRDGWVSDHSLVYPELVTAKLGDGTVGSQNWIETVALLCTSHLVLGVT